MYFLSNIDFSLPNRIHFHLKLLVREADRLLIPSIGSDRNRKTGPYFPSRGIKSTDKGSSCI
jgi:hypothetical protein